MLNFYLVKKVMDFHYQNANLIPNKRNYLLIISLNLLNVACMKDFYVFKILFYIKYSQTYPKIK